MIAVDSGTWIDLFRVQPIPCNKTFNSLIAHRAREMESMSDECTAGLNICLTGAQRYRAVVDVERAVRSAMDVLIAAFCFERSDSLRHGDRSLDGFSGFRGLKCFDTRQAGLSLKITDD